MITRQDVRDRGKKALEVHREWALNTFKTLLTDCKKIVPGYVKWFGPKFVIAKKVTVWLDAVGGTIRVVSPSGDVSYRNEGPLCDRMLAELSVIINQEKL